MNLLLDTHALIWWFRADPLLGAAARRAMEDLENAVYISAISALEITTKVRLGKLQEAEPLARELDQVPARFGFTVLPVELRHASLAGSLLISSKDPFDRVLIAQSLLEGMVLVSNEAPFDTFGVSRLW